MKNIIQDMSYMFCFCKSLTYIDLSKCNLTLDVNKVKKMFGFCQNLKEVNIREMMLEGVLAIQSGVNPRIVEEKLISYLEPAERLEYLKNNAENSEGVA